MLCNGTGVVIPGRNAPSLPWAGTGLLPMAVHPNDTDAANPGAIPSTYLAESLGNQLVIGGQGTPCDTAPGSWWGWGIWAGRAISTQRLLGIERKIDDGSPRSGKVTAGGTNLSGGCVSSVLPSGAYNQTDTDACYVPFLVRPSW